MSSNKKQNKTAKDRKNMEKNTTMKLISVKMR